MGLSAEAQHLTRAHATAQKELGAVTVEQLRAVWPVLDLTDLDGTFDKWFALAAPVVRAQRTASARLAGNYLTVYRSLEVGHDKSFHPVLSELVPAEKLATSLRVTGPISLKSNVGRGMLLEEAARIADEGAARAGSRLALEGGRDTLMESIAADPRALRWSRVVTSDKPCEFCLMLADRGAVYSADTVEFQAHDGCSCMAEPGY